MNHKLNELHRAYKKHAWRTLGYPAAGDNVTVLSHCSCGLFAVGEIKAPLANGLLWNWARPSYGGHRAILDIIKAQTPKIGAAYRRYVAIMQATPSMEEMTKRYLGDE
jgi:hypothetical protein